jgi:hypothetical protein
MLEEFYPLCVTLKVILNKNPNNIHAMNIIQWLVFSRMTFDKKNLDITEDTSSHRCQGPCGSTRVRRTVHVLRWY